MWTKSELTKLAKEIHENNVDKGFWPKDRNMQECKMLIITELSEAVEAHREGQYAAASQFKDELKRQEEWGNLNKDYKSVFQMCIKDTLQDELADAFIRCLDYIYFRDRDYLIVPDINKQDWSDNFAENMLFICRNITGSPIGVVAGYIISYCKHANINLKWHVEQKFKYNKLRSHKHGKEY